MYYDVQIGKTTRREISYAELVMLPVEHDTFVRRESGAWMQAKDCVELSHILDQRILSSTALSNASEYSEINNDSHFEDYINRIMYSGDDMNECEEHCNSWNIKGCQESCQIVNSNSLACPHLHVQMEEDRIFIPSAEYFKCKQKRKAAIIGVCTLGFAGLSLMGIGNIWRSNIFEGTSFSANEGMAFVLKCLSFCLLAALIAIPYFIYSVFALIYYSIRLNNLRS